MNMDYLVRDRGRRLESDEQEKTSIIYCTNNHNHSSLRIND